MSERLFLTQVEDVGELSDKALGAIMKEIKERLKDRGYDACGETKVHHSIKHYYGFSTPIESDLPPGEKIDLGEITARWTEEVE